MSVYVNYEITSKTTKGEEERKSIVILGSENGI
jgi:hypothetical protein